MYRPEALHVCRQYCRGFFSFRKRVLKLLKAVVGFGCLWQSLIDSRDGSASVADDTSDRQRNEAGDGLHKTESVHL